MVAKPSLIPKGSEDLNVKLSSPTKSCSGVYKALNVDKSTVTSILLTIPFEGKFCISILTILSFSGSFEERVISVGVLFAMVDDPSRGTGLLLISSQELRRWMSKPCLESDSLSGIVLVDVEALL